MNNPLTRQNLPLHLNSQHPFRSELAAPEKAARKPWFLRAPVSLIKDSEFPDRFWLRTAGAGQMMELMFAACELGEFTNAVTEAIQELQC